MSTSLTVHKMLCITFIVCVVTPLVTGSPLSNRPPTNLDHDRKEIIDVLLRLLKKPAQTINPEDIQTSTTTTLSTTSTLGDSDQFALELVQFLNQLDYQDPVSTSGERTGSPPEDQDLLYKMFVEYVRSRERKLGKLSLTGVTGTDDKSAKDERGVFHPWGG